MPLPLLPIIFSGSGSNLYPLCDASSASSSSSPSACKALLPVANRPLLAFALQNLLSAGLTSCLLLAPASQHAAITRAISTFRLIPPQTLPLPGEKRKAKETKEEKNWIGVSIVDATSSRHHSTSESAGMTMKVELLPLGPFDGKHPEEVIRQEEFKRHTLETAELLRWVASLGKLEADPLIIPVDLIAPSMPIREVIELYTEAQASLHGTPTMCCALYERGAGEGTSKEREREGPPRMLSSYSHQPEDQRRLLLVGEAEMSEDLVLKKSLLRACPLMRLSTNMLDSHVYILNRAQVLPLLEANTNLTSLREHILPLIAKASWMKGLKEKANWKYASPADEPKEAADELDMGEDNVKNRLARLSQDTSLARLSLSRSSTQRLKKGKAAGSDIRCLTIVTTLQAQEHDGPLPRFISRANTVATYLECNRWLLKAFVQQMPIPYLIPSISTDHMEVPSLPNGDALQAATAQISSDTLIGAAVKIGDRASIKRSVVGNKCEVARGVRLSGCILMDGCKILENARLENVIVCAGATIGERSTLKDCDVATGVILAADTSAKNEKLVDDRSEDEAASDEDR